MEVLLATAAFDVTTADVQRHDVGIVRNPPANASPAVPEHRNRSSWLLRRQERVVAIDRRGVEEDAARGDLRNRAHVREHQLRVDVGELCQLVVAHRAEAVARVRTQVVIDRTEVVLVRRAAKFGTLP